MINETGLTLRVVEIVGDPWFVAADVCKALGTETKDVRANLDSDEVSTLALPGRAGRPMLILSEPGLYCLVLKSRKPQAKDFQKWVRATVLPAIRRDGSYVMGEEKAQSPEELAALLEASDFPDPGAPRADDEQLGDCQPRRK